MSNGDRWRRPLDAHVALPAKVGRRVARLLLACSVLAVWWGLIVILSGRNGDAEHGLSAKQKESNMKFLKRLMSWLEKPRAGAHAHDGPSEPLEHDYLGRAEAVQHEVEEALRDRRHDDAWRGLHEQKALYLKHAQRSGLSAREALALDGSVHEELAQILRFKKKHQDALVHLMYCVASSPAPTKAQQKKLAAYFKRCRFSGVAPQQADKAMRKFAKHPDLRQIKSVVNGWSLRDRALESTKATRKPKQ